MNLIMPSYVCLYLWWIINVYQSVVVCCRSGLPVYLPLAVDYFLPWLWFRLHLPACGCRLCSPVSSLDYNNVPVCGLELIMIIYLSVFVDNICLSVGVDCVLSECGHRLCLPVCGLRSCYDYLSLAVDNVHLSVVAFFVSQFQIVAKEVAFDVQSS